MNLTVPDIIGLAAAPPSEGEFEMLAAVQSIDSLTNRSESLALHRLCSLLPEKARVLEIGSFNGASAVAMGFALQRIDGCIYCIDPWFDYAGQEDFSDLEAERIADRKIIASFLGHTGFLGSRVKMMRGTLADFAGMVSGQNFDLIFIDGAHDYDSVRHDILVSLAALKPGGILCGHDYHSMGHGVRRAVDELVGYIHSIKVKGTIDDTFIWVAVIDDPEYLLGLHRISECAAAGDFSKALEMAKETLIRHKTPELVEMVSQYKTQLFMAMQGKGAGNGH